MKLQIKDMSNDLDWSIKVKVHSPEKGNCLEEEIIEKLMTIEFMKMHSKNIY